MFCKHIFPNIILGVNRFSNKLKGFLRFLQVIEIIGIGFCQQIQIKGRIITQDFGSV